MLTIGSKINFDSTLYFVQVRHIVVGFPGDDMTLRFSVGVVYHIQLND